MGARETVSRCVFAELIRPTGSTVSWLAWLTRVTMSAGLVIGSMQQLWRQLAVLYPGVGYDVAGMVP
eukprot:SAG25_NODE_3729_length_985_cov_1.735892_2_plen_66_part_01